MANRALIVGINDYPGREHDLESCVNDARNWEKLAHDSFGCEVEALVDSNATCANVEAALRRLMKNAKPEDNLLFFYSGHGYQETKNNVKEEYLYLYDGPFQDDRLSQLTQEIPPGVLTVVLDSCFSGGMEKCLFDLVDGDRARAKWWLPERQELMKEIQQERSVNAYRPFGCRPVRMNWNANGMKALRQRARKAADDEADQLQINALLIAACLDNEPASANAPGTDGLSAFTFAFFKAISRLGQNASAIELVREADRQLKSRGFRQTPIVKEPRRPAGFGARAFLAKNAAALEMHREVRRPEEIREIVSQVFERTAQREAAWGDKGWERWVPVAIEALRAAMREKGLGEPAAMGLPAAYGGAPWAGEPGHRDWRNVQDLAPVIAEIVRAVQQGPQAQQPYRPEETALIPAIAGAVAAAVRAQQAPATEKAMGAWAPVIAEALRILAQRRPAEAPYAERAAMPYGNAGLNGDAYPGYANLQSATTPRW